MIAAALKLERRPNDQIFYCTRDQDLIGFSECSDACTDVDCDTFEPVSHLRTIYRPCG